MPGKLRSNCRSGCPVSVSLEIFGDPWSLLIVRDLMVRGYRTFKEFHQAGEGIATNILADRLRKLEAAEIIVAEAMAADGRRVNYRLTEKGIDLAPVLLELLIWGARHEKTEAPYAAIETWKSIVKRCSPKCGGDGRNGTQLHCYPDLGRGVGVLIERAQKPLRMHLREDD